MVLRTLIYFRHGVRLAEHDSACIRRLPRQQWQEAQRRERLRRRRLRPQEGGEQLQPGQPPALHPAHQVALAEREADTTIQGKGRDRKSQYLVSIWPVSKLDH